MAAWTVALALVTMPPKPGYAAAPVAASPESSPTTEPAPPEATPDEDPDAVVAPDEDAVDDAAESVDAPPKPEGAGPDEVTLRSGGLVRGVVTEAEPKSHVTIIIGGSGEVRRIPWANVDRVERGKHAVDRPEPGSLAAPGRPKVHLELEGRGAGADVRLYEIRPKSAAAPAEDGTATDVEVCAAPCDEIIDGRAGQQFAVDGKGVSRSLSFSLIDAPSELTIRVRPGRRALAIAGWIVASVGAAAVVGGATALTLSDDDDTRRKAGGYTFLAGLPLVAGGGVMIAFGRTRVRIGPAASRPRR